MKGGGGGVGLLMYRDLLILLVIQHDSPRDLRLPLSLMCRRGKDMPIRMGDNVQSVVIGRSVYVGGGSASLADNPDKCTVMKLDLERNEWTKLPEYNNRLFSMASLANRLVLVGGMDPVSRKATNQTAVFESGRWMNSYPPLNIARCCSTAVGFNNYIVVVGGRDDQERSISYVEMLDMATRRWYIAESLAKPRASMKSIRIGNALYIMGGLDHYNRGTKVVHKVDLNELITKVATQQATLTLWQEVVPTPLETSTPINIGGYLLAVGGTDNANNPSSSIHLYQPESKRWVEVNNLPAARYYCTCSVLPSGEIIVAGGQTETFDEISTVNFLTISEAEL